MSTYEIAAIRRTSIDVGSKVVAPSVRVEVGFRALHSKVIGVPLWLHVASSNVLPSHVLTIVFNNSYDYGRNVCISTSNITGMQLSSSKVQLDIGIRKHIDSTPTTSRWQAPYMRITDSHDGNSIEGWQHRTSHASGSPREQAGALSSIRKLLCSLLLSFKLLSLLSCLFILHVFLWNNERSA
jgi:hypothetical protein